MPKPTNKPGRQTITLHREQVKLVDDLVKRVRSLGFRIKRNEAARLAVELSATAKPWLGDDTIVEALRSVRMEAITR